MPRIAVSYGPPGHRGVDTLLGLGADEIAPDKVDDLLTKAGWGAVAVWGLGVVLNRPLLRNGGLGGAAAAFGVRYLARK